MCSFPPTKQQPHKARFDKNGVPQIVRSSMCSFMCSFSRPWAVFSRQGTNHSRLHQTEVAYSHNQCAVLCAVFFSYVQFSKTMCSFFITRHRSWEDRFDKNGVPQIVCSSMCSFMCSFSRPCAVSRRIHSTYPALLPVLYIRVWAKEFLSLAFSTFELPCVSCGVCCCVSRSVCCSSVSWLSLVMRSIISCTSRLLSVCSSARLRSVCSRVGLLYFRS